MIEQASDNREFVPDRDISSAHQAVLEDFPTLCSETAQYLKPEGFSYLQNSMQYTYNDKTYQSYAGYSSGAIWYPIVGMIDEDQVHTHLGQDLVPSPDDYLEIRESEEKLERFIVDTLQQGDITTGGGHAGYSDYKPSSYINFIAEHCENEEFCKRYQAALLKLLTQELARDYKNYRTIKKEVRGESPEREPQEYEFKRRYNEQFHLVLGLLESTCEIAKENPAFAAQAAELVNERLHDGREIEHRAIEGFLKHRYYKTQLLDTLAVCQEADGRFEDFWLECISSEKDVWDVSAAVHGLLNSQPSGELEAQQQLATKAIRALGKRERSSDGTLDISKPVVSRFPGYPLKSPAFDFIIRDIQERCHLKPSWEEQEMDIETSEDPIYSISQSYPHYLDLETGAIDVVRSNHYIDDSYHLLVGRLDSESQRHTIEARYDLKSGTLHGDPSVMDVYNALIEREGYFYSRRLSVTAINIKEDNEGTISGLIELEDMPFSFQANLESGELLLGAPSLEKTYMSPRERPAFSKREIEELEFGELQDLDSLGRSIDQKLASEKHPRACGDAIRILGNQVSGEIKDFLLHIIRLHSDRID